jgi:hypothetical protein
MHHVGYYSYKSRCTINITKNIEDYIPLGRHHEVRLTGPDISKQNSAFFVKGQRS